ncbi:Tetratricopeptide repeat protein 12 [Sparganum proliferum]
MDKKLKSPGSMKLTKEELDGLKKANQIQDIIKNMSSSDKDVAEKAIKDAENMLKELEGDKKKPEVNRTFINTSKGEAPPAPTNGQPEYMDVEAFKVAIAADAEERSKRRAKRMAKAEKLKSQANDYFKAGDWENAVNIYTQAIDVCKDWSVLYTNRAQAYLRCGKPEKALADCDLALRLLPPEPMRTPTNIGEEADKARNANLMAAKACLHRGKALLVLRRPRDALQAYSDSRAFKACSENPAVTAKASSSPDQWPTFLREYVAQAQAAIAAENVDSQAEELMQTRIGTMEADASLSYLLKPSEDNFLRLIAEAACGGRELPQYTSILCQMAKVLSAVTTEAEKSSSSSSTNGQPSNSDAATSAGDQAVEVESKLEDSASAGAGTGDSEVRNSTSRRRRRKGGRQSQQSSPDTAAASANGEPVEVDKGEGVTLEQLQSYFRVKNGFKVLAKQMNLLESTGSLKAFYSEVNDRDPVSSEKCLQFVDHLLALLTVSYYLCRDCGENQRLLVENTPELFSRVLVECLELSPTTIQLPSSTNSASVTPGDLDVEIRHRHKLDILRYSACELLALMSAEASGREGLLASPGPARLLASIALCLSDALGLPKSPADGLRKPKKPALPVNTVGSSFAVQTVAAIARVLESLTSSPRFLSMVRSSDCFEGLQDVVEAAVAVPSSASASTSTTAAPAMCLSLLLDCLSFACHDIGLRRRLVSKPNFVLNLANCLVRHAPLIADDNHVALVGSLCRTLHNCLTGENAAVPTQPELEALLSGVGIVLDQPSRGPVILAVVIVLLGKIMPLCSHAQIDKWCKSGNPITSRSDGRKPDYTERVNILLSIIKSDSPSVLHEVPKTVADSSGKVYESESSLAAHRLRGSIRALAAITKSPGCEDVRFAIGDSRLITRRLACLVRVRTAFNGEPPKPAPGQSAPLPPRDEPLVANVCLILQQCINDTPLAEHLTGTSIILDLLKVITEADRLETKRNAAIVVGKLASSSHVHRDELNRLNGMRVLTPFAQWTNALCGDFIGSRVAGGH